MSMSVSVTLGGKVYRKRADVAMATIDQDHGELTRTENQYGRESQDWETQQEDASAGLSVETTRTVSRATLCSVRITDMRRISCWRAVTRLDRCRGKCSTPVLSSSKTTCMPRDFFKFTCIVKRALSGLWNLAGAAASQNPHKLCAWTRELLSR